MGGHLRGFKRLLVKFHVFNVETRRFDPIFPCAQAPVLCVTAQIAQIFTETGGFRGFLPKSRVAQCFNQMGHICRQWRLELHVFVCNGVNEPQNSRM